MLFTPRGMRTLASSGILSLMAACPGDLEPEVPVADIFVDNVGEPAPYATPEQMASFERGFDLLLHRFSPEEGLGPSFNVVSCAACHEGPEIGGVGPRYRDFYLHGVDNGDGSTSLAPDGGVVKSYAVDGQTRPGLMEGANVQGKRSAMPIFGAGAIAEIFERSILANVDEEDTNGDGISGRANYNKGYLGRFGRKAQKATVEGFIRGPINNHGGITSDPLTKEQNDALPVDHSVELPWLYANEKTLGRLTDDDAVADPELAPDEVFDIVTYSMLLGPPKPDESPSEAAMRGKEAFAELGCESCHVPALEGARGMVPLYSDLLIHDMGPELADGISMGDSMGSEFRTQPLWGAILQRPYLHDGRADTLEQAIMMHGGEAASAQQAYASVSSETRADVVAFLESLGGAHQASPGLLPPDAEIPEAGTPGAPLPLADDAEREMWRAGRDLFELDFGESQGLGPLFNGDSCRGCHFDPLDERGRPTVGGAGPLDVNVVRHGTLAGDGNFVAPQYGTILHKLSVAGAPRREHTTEHNVFEMRQTPSTLGLGLLSSVAADDLRAIADPMDLDGDGVAGIVHELGDGRVGRLGWKAQVPSVREFVRDAMSAEMGITLPEEAGFTYGVTSDEDDVPDPELSSEQIDSIAFFIEHLAPPMPTEDVPGGFALFSQVGCDTCHRETIPGSGEDFPTPAYTDLLLHSVAMPDARGIDDGVGVGTLFRTPPLWGVSGSAPYMHDGLAGTVEDAIAAHDGEAQASRRAYEALDSADQATLIRWVESR